MDKNTVKSYSNHSLDFAINDLLEVIKIQETFPNPTIAQKTKLSNYHKDLLMCVTEKVNRHQIINPL